jgi:hypothetical protein
MYLWAAPLLVDVVVSLGCIDGQCSLPVSIGSRHTALHGTPRHGHPPIGLCNLLAVGLQDDGHCTNQLLCKVNVQEFIGAVRIRARPQHPRHNELGLGEHLTLRTVGCGVVEYGVCVCVSTSVYV